MTFSLLLLLTLSKGHLGLLQSHFEIPWTHHHQLYPQLSKFATLASLYPLIPFIAALSLIQELLCQLVRLMYYYFKPWMPLTNSFCMFIHDHSLTLGHQYLELFHMSQIKLLWSISKSFVSIWRLILWELLIYRCLTICSQPLSPHQLPLNQHLILYCFAILLLQSIKLCASMNRLRSSEVR